MRAADITTCSYGSGFDSLKMLRAGDGIFPSTTSKDKDRVAIKDATVFIRVIASRSRMSRRCEISASWYDLARTLQSRIQTRRVPGVKTHWKD